MVHATVLFTGLLIAVAGDAPNASHDLRTYEALKAKAGKDSQAQVKLALWCEAHGLTAERVKHLAQAVLSDPKDVTARGLLGLVAFGGRWESADKIGERVKADAQRAAKLAEYEGRRAKLAEKEAGVRKAEERYKALGQPEAAYAVRLKANHDLAQVHAGLGLWCQRQGLKPEAMAHFTTAVHLDPSRDSSWRNLGCVKRNGRWMSPEQAAADERDEHEQRLANRRWEPLIRKWKTWLGDGPSSSSHRAEAREQLASLSDPRAVPSILKVFSIGGSEAEQTQLLQLLGRFDDPRSSRAVADLAVMTRSESVRLAAIAVLKNRPRRDYAGQLVEMIRGKIRHTVIPVNGPGSTGALILDTPRVRMVLTYDTPAVFQPASSFRGYAGYDANGLPVIVQGRELDRGIIGPTKLHEIEVRTAGLIAVANLKAQVVQQRMSADLNEVEMVNEQAEASNTRIAPVLEVAAGAPSDLKDDEEAWHVWWYDTLGYSYQSPPQVTLVQDASPSQLPPPYITTCFVAGTPVRTLDGPRPIEAIQVGDQVLSQDATTGAIGFQSVVFLHHNPPGKTLRVSLANGESLVCSVYHRFWRANVGWTMARDLKPGDTLRNLGGLVRVAKVEPDSIQPLYNLDVSGPRSFFVGASNVLVHDNTLPDHRLKPFDALPVVEVSPRPE
jgi:tetratricopeptide (TPR) repeat protein